ncbi:sporulation protein YqfC [Acetivibrio mesophilus]|uniref:Sporulation protein YqfC n=1 Tax=Acetivibrio mesophilus TaxID=2487273 RepID=A0A4V1K2D5_9FIRM|nr:sporulation protein YqfC [Acetivibrio mesophilus]ODM25089.1 sporulation protein YqfC [Clostridium sp. Bc-iso-3]RXE59909.1 sporulation protein YqfC [Acetivibrio mesophilus]HHV29684.1 sporulation protein YqfC [Clostridium sp.]
MPEKRTKSAKKRKEEEQKINLKEKMAELLELPKEIVLDLPKITMFGNKNLIVENYKGIIEYDNNRIRVNTGKGIIRVAGDSLVIKEITSEDLMIDGEILSLEFLK